MQHMCDTTDDGFTGSFSEVIDSESRGEVLEKLVRGSRVFKKRVFGYA